MDQTYTISGMHCGACVGRVTAALKPFSELVSVTLDPPRAVLTNSHGSDLAALNSALAAAGAYSLQPLSSAASSSDMLDDRSWLQTYFPLLVISGYIAIASFAGTSLQGSFDWHGWMTNFMAGFFLVFSAFKFLNLSGFADAYATYDLLAKRRHVWGFIYPFLEFALGLAYLFRFAPFATNVATVLLMGFSSLGVIQALRQKGRIECACLGTVLKLPMSSITLVEDLGMAAMAAMSLAFLA